jgi:hypothetical protein
MPQAPLKRKAVRDPRLIASDASDASDSAWADNALTAGECPFILAPVMGVTRQAGETSSGAWGQAEGGRRPEGAFCATMALHGQGCMHKCLPKSNQSQAPTLSFHL